MISFIPIRCPRCNLKLTKSMQTTNMNSEYLFRCEEPRCINLSYSLDFKFLGLTYFLAKQGENSTVVSLVPLDLNDSYSNLLLTVGIGKPAFKVNIPSFDPNDMSKIFNIVKTYMIFS